MNRKEYVAVTNQLARRVKKAFKIQKKKGFSVYKMAIGQGFSDTLLSNVMNRKVERIGLEKYKALHSWLLYVENE